MRGPDAYEHFQRNTRVLFRNLEGVSEQGGLMRAPNSGNSVRWILGHLLRSRQEVLAIVNGPSIIDMERLECCRRGGKGAYTDEELPSLEELKEWWQQTDAALEPALVDIDMDAAEPEWGTVEKALVGYCFHEAYHTGQTGILRRFIGLEGALG